jgi:acetate kinase
MKILALNCGSSSLKFQVRELADEEGGGWEEECLAKGTFQLGNEGEIDLALPNHPRVVISRALTSHANAVRFLWRWLDHHAELRPKSLHAVGFRIVHGGVDFDGPVQLDEENLQALSALTELVPLHHQAHAALEIIREVQSLLGTKTPLVASFDTTFHRTLPPPARRYAISEALTTRHGLWRYGFHGLAHRWMMERYAAVAGRALGASKIISFQLGSGCSATAIRSGQSVETSMGLTPQEGLMMATRAGDVDPALPALLAKFEGISREQAEECLNTRAGLLGVSGTTSDFRALLEAERRGDRRAALARAMFSHRARHYLGAYLAVLGGADAILFGGGIGENHPEVRADICANMEWCGLALDEQRNQTATARETRISADNSSIAVHVIPVSEEVLIARDAFQCLGQAGEAAADEREPAHADTEGLSALPGGRSPSESIFCPHGSKPVDRC